MTTASAPRVASDETPPPLPSLSSLYDNDKKQESNQHETPSSMATNNTTITTTCSAAVDIPQRPAVVANDSVVMLGTTNHDTAVLDTTEPTSAGTGHGCDPDTATAEVLAVPSLPGVGTETTPRSKNEEMDPTTTLAGPTAAATTTTTTATTLSTPMSTSKTAATTTSSNHAIPPANHDHGMNNKNKNDEGSLDIAACCLCHCALDYSDRAAFFPADRQVDYQETAAGVGAAGDDEKMGHDGDEPKLHENEKGPDSNAATIADAEKTSPKQVAVSTIKTSCSNSSNSSNTSEFFFRPTDPYLPVRVYDKNNALLYCDGPGCGRLFHQKCHFVPVLTIPRGDWLCLLCQVDQQQQHSKTKRNKNKKKQQEKVTKPRKSATKKKSKAADTAQPDPIDSQFLFQSPPVYMRKETGVTATGMTSADDNDDKEEATPSPTCTTTIHADEPRRDTADEAAENAAKNLASMEKEATTIHNGHHDKKKTNEKDDDTPRDTDNGSQQLQSQVSLAATMTTTSTIAPPSSTVEANNTSNRPLDDNGETSQSSKKEIKKEPIDSTNTTTTVSYKAENEKLPVQETPLADAISSNTPSDSCIVADTPLSSSLWPETPRPPPPPIVLTREQIETAEQRWEYDHREFIALAWKKELDKLLQSSAMGQLSNLRQSSSALESLITTTLSSKALSGSPTTILQWAYNSQELMQLLVKWTTARYKLRDYACNLYSIQKWTERSWNALQAWLTEHVDNLEAPTNDNNDKDNNNNNNNTSDDDNKSDKRKEMEDFCKRVLFPFGRDLLRRTIPRTPEMKLELQEQQQQQQQNGADPHNMGMKISDQKDNRTKIPTEIAVHQDSSADDENDDACDRKGMCLGIHTHAKTKKTKSVKKDKANPKSAKATSKNGKSIKNGKAASAKATKEETPTKKRKASNSTKEEKSPKKSKASSTALREEKPSKKSKSVSTGSKELKASPKKKRGSKLPVATKENDDKPTKKGKGSTTPAKVEKKSKGKVAKAGSEKKKTKTKSKAKSKEESPQKKRKSAKKGSSSEPKKASKKTEKRKGKNGNKMEEKSMDEDDKNSGISLDDLQCCICRASEATDENDLVMCDGAGCYRAYHMKCVKPEVTAKDLEDENGDWFCPICYTLGELIHIIQTKFMGSEWEARRYEAYAEGRSMDESLKSWDHVDEVFPDAEDDYDRALQLKAGKRNKYVDDLLAALLGLDYNPDDNDDDNSVGDDEDDDGHFDLESYEGKGKGKGSNESHDGKKKNHSGGRDDDDDDDDDSDDSSHSSEATLAEMSSVELDIQRDELAALSEVDESDDEAGEAKENGEHNEPTSSLELAQGTMRRSRRLRKTRSPSTTTTSSKKRPKADLGEFNEANIIFAKRTRKPIDYRRLNEALFGDLSEKDIKKIDGGADFKIKTKPKAKLVQSDSEGHAEDDNRSTASGGDEARNGMRE